MVRRPGQRVQPVEAGERQSNGGRRKPRILQENRTKSSAILREMRRASHDQSSSAGNGGCVRGDAAYVEVRACGARELLGDGSADERRAAQAEGFPKRVRRLGRGGTRVIRAQSRGCALRVGPYHFLLTENRRS